MAVTNKSRVGLCNEPLEPFVRYGKPGRERSRNDVECERHSRGSDERSLGIRAPDAHALGHSCILDLFDGVLPPHLIKVLDKSLFRSRLNMQNFIQSEERRPT